MTSDKVTVHRSTFGGWTPPKEKKNSKKPPPLKIKKISEQELAIRRLSVPDASTRLAALEEKLKCKIEDRNSAVGPKQGRLQKQINSMQKEVEWLKARIERG